MKVNKSYLGRMCQITWRDPISENDRMEIDKAPKGNVALAKWVEYGVIDDLTDGVVRFQHSVAFDPSEAKPHEALFGWIPEDLIESIVVLVPETERNE